MNLYQNVKVKQDAEVMDYDEGYKGRTGKINKIYPDDDLKVVFSDGYFLILHPSEVEEVLNKKKCHSRQLLAAKNGISWPIV